MKQPDLTVARERAQIQKNAGSALATIAFISLLGWHTASDAGIYKCVASDGSISYSQSECPYNEKTAKVMSSSGRKPSNINCSVADEFLRQTAETMRSGTPSGAVISSYGGFGAISSVVVGMINYIYTFSGNLTTTAERVHELAMQNCRSGSFGLPTCQNLPLDFTSRHGSCAANSTNRPLAAAATRSNTRSNNSRSSNSRNNRNSNDRNRNSSASGSKSPAAVERERRRAERQAQRELQAEMDEDE